jgi:hypothetical protein
MIGVALVALGAVAAVSGVRLALERPRPISLAGALLAPVGLALALLGAGRLVFPGFLGGDAPLRAPRILAAADGSVRTSLRQRLALAGHQVDFVGDASADVPALELGRRLARDLPVLRPDLVLLDAGAADVRAGADAATAAGRVAELVDLVLDRAPRAVVLLASPVEGVRQMALDRAARTGRVRFVDVAARGRAADAWFDAVALWLRPVRR